jgi:hypothetical protein
MGRLRASLLDCVGVKFDRAFLDKRLLNMGVTDDKVRANLVNVMESAHTKTAFLDRIRKDKNR